MLAAGTIARKILRSHAIAKKIRTLRPGIPSPRVLHNPAPSQNIMPGGNTGLRLPAPRQAQPSFVVKWRCAEVLHPANAI